MPRPETLTIYDEIRSLQMYVKSEFTTDRIKIERPQEDVQYDILIEPVTEIMSTARGTYMTDETMPVTIQRWCTSYIEALDAIERFKMLFRKGKGQGDRSRIPVWKHPLPGDNTTPVPDPAADEPLRYLRVDDLSTQILPSQTIGQYVAVCDVRLLGWRITYDFTDQLIEHVARAKIE